ncbi:hypothetical protein FXW26_04385 [Candidatus Liberibacter asiaticus]|nr:hypothetical protein FXW26_04385 [Candidatus Liberibacter asiaticus]
MMELLNVSTISLRNAVILFSSVFVRLSTSRNVLSVVDLRLLQKESSFS